MKKKNKIKLSISDLHVKSFSATLRKDQTKDLIGGSVVLDTDACDSMVTMYCGGGDGSGNGVSQTACATECRDTDYDGCYSAGDPF